MIVIKFILSALLGYGLGCISTGLILSGKASVDIRSMGSKSTGATNMTRVMGLRHGLLTFIGDFLKAALAVWLGYLIAGRDGSLISGLFVIIGHNWPFLYGFKGGKGIVCSSAVLLFVTPMEGLVSGIIALLVIYLTRYVSLGSLSLLFVAAVMLPFTRGIWPYGAWGILLFLLAAYQHRANIKRLINGTESKFTGKKDT
ncbi:MAG: glycerol-3-phosphate acyltransferase [Clostridiales bacterium]|nr:glycerol-3-phosphate acyltransferase [Clostridiales bacterium]